MLAFSMTTKSYERSLNDIMIENPSLPVYCLSLDENNVNKSLLKCVNEYFEEDKEYFQKQIQIMPNCSKLNCCDTDTLEKSRYLDYIQSYPMLI